MRKIVEPSARARKLAEMQAYRDELEALGPREGPPGIDVLQVPPGTLCVVNSLAGEVWLSQGYPQRRWLTERDADAIASSDANELRHYGGSGIVGTGDS
jgi:hypothetical protein